MKYQYHILIMEENIGNDKKTHYKMMRQQELRQF